MEKETYALLTARMPIRFGGVRLAVGAYFVARGQDASGLIRHGAAEEVFPLVDGDLLKDDHKPEPGHVVTVSDVDRALLEPLRKTSDPAPVDDEPTVVGKKATAKKTATKKAATKKAATKKATVNKPDKGTQTGDTQTGDTQTGDTQTGDTQAQTNPDKE